MTRSSCGLRHESSEGLRFDAHGSRKSVRRMYHGASPTATNERRFTAQTQVSGPHTLSRVTAPVHSCGASPADARKKTNRRAVKRRHRSQSKSHAEFATEFHHADSIVKLLHCRPWTDLTDDSVLSRETVPYSSAVSRLLHIGSTQEPGGRSWLYVEANQSSDR